MNLLPRLEGAGTRNHATFWPNTVHSANKYYSMHLRRLLKSLRRKITLKGGHGGKAAGGAEVADFSNVLVCLRRRSVQTLILAGALAAFGIYSPLVYLVSED